MIGLPLGRALVLLCIVCGLANATNARADEPPAHKPDASRLQEGLIGYWPLDGDLRRADAKEPDGEVSRGAFFVPSPFGKALRTRGRNEHACIRRTPAMNIGEGDFTVAAWIRANAQWQSAIVCLGGTDNRHGFLFSLYPDGVVGIETADAQGRSNGQLRTPRWTLPSDEWTHVAVSVKRGDDGARIYVNGYEMARGTIGDANLDNPNANLCFARIENGMGFFRGDIDEVRLYRRALAPAEIQALVEPGRRFAERPMPMDVAPSVRRFGEPSEPPERREPFPNGRFTLEEGDVVVFAGQTDMVRSRRDATLEALLALEFAEAKPKFRNMAWEGDTVYQQWRDLNFGSWTDQFVAAEASVIIAQFGQVEALDGVDKLNAFIAAYEKLLDEFQRTTARIVLVSPRPFETPEGEHFIDNTSRNDDVRRYAEAIRDLAQRRGFVFVDLFHSIVDGSNELPRLTSNGLHLTPEGQTIVGRLVARQLGVASDAVDSIDRLRKLIAAKNELWFDNWRPANWAFAFGDRTEQPFGQPIADNPALRIELEEFKPLIRDADHAIHQAALALRDGKQVVASIELQEPATVSAEATPTVDHSIEAELESFQILDGFDVTIFASEADGVVKPVQMKWDARGRLWVLCTPTYPHIEPGVAPKDYILICEDADGDGRADTFKRFAEGLTMPMGLEFGKDGVYVCMGTELIYLRDTDGDERADQREVILSGFGVSDAHQMINSVTFGPGGELFFSQGHHVYSHIETPRGVATLHRAGVWRYRPLTGRLHGFFNMSTAGLNCWGVTYDDWGQIFHNSGAGSGGFYTVPGMIPTLRPLPYWAMAVPDRRNTGFEIIGTQHMPDDLQGCIVWGAFMSNAVHLHRMVEEGAGFTAEVLPDLIKSTRREFRPVDCRVGPDGAIYVCDWYNAIIGHYQASYRDPNRDKSHGRIWRVTAKGRPTVRRTDLSKMSIPELLEQFRSPERLTRVNARRQLFNAPADQAIAALDKWIASLDPADPLYEHLLTQAVGVYEAHEAAPRDLLLKLLAADDYRARAYAARVIGHWSEDKPADSERLNWLRQLVRDEHPRVRMEAIVACSYAPTAEAVAIATQALDLPRDRFIDYALSQTVSALKPYWQPALDNGKLDLGGRAHHLQFILESDGTNEIASSVRKLVEHRVKSSKAGASSDEARALVKLLANVGGPDDLRLAFDLSVGDTALLSEIADVATVRKERPSGDLKAPLSKLLASDDAGVRVAALRLIGAWRVDSLAGSARSELKSSEAPEVTAAALRTLAILDRQAALATVEPFAGTAQPHVVRAAAIAAASSIDVTRGAKLAARLMPHAADEAQMADLINPLLERRDGADALAAAIKEAKIEADPAKLAHRVLSAAGRGDESLVAVLNEVIGISAVRLEYDPALVSEIAQAATSLGDASRGRQVFLSKLANCTACHKVGSEGGDLGPDLTIVGAGRAPELLVESLLWPNRQIREGYMSTRVLTDDGRIFTGYKIKEAAGELHFRDASTGQVRRFPLSSIEEMEDAGSIMPEGLTAAMTREEVRDLVRYLMELGKPK